MTDWDGFRDGYATMTYEEHREWYDDVSKVYPVQHYYSLSDARRFFAEREIWSVVELGGWDGNLAADILADEPEIVSWTNFEIADVPQVCDDARYTRALPKSWMWDQTLTADAFVASHSLEHLSADHLEALLGALDCSYAYVDVPLAGQTSWRGSTTTHVLHLSMEEFQTAWQNHGWTIEHAGRSEAHESQVRFFKST